MSCSTKRRHVILDQGGGDHEQGEHDEGNALALRATEDPHQ
jgi:hypothetical protein